MQINWYPGHMAKAKREMEKMIKLSDVAVEIVDARAPMSTRNPDLDRLLGNKPRVIILNKEDLADKNLTRAWLQYFSQEGWNAVSFCAKKQGGRDKLLSAIQKAAQPLIDGQKRVLKKLCVS